MQIDFDTEIRDLANQPIMNGDKHLDLATIATNALLTPQATDQNMPPDEKIKRFRLAQRITNGGAVDIPLEDIVLLKDIIGKFYPPLVVGRAFELFDPAPGKSNGKDNENRRAQTS
jgi:hypothetical protein